MTSKNVRDLTEEERRHFADKPLSAWIQHIIAGGKTYAGHPDYDERWRP